MPEFAAGEAKTARVPMRNPTSKAFDYRGEIYMGTDLAKMSEQLFHLNAGEEKQVSFPVTMPALAGTYPVHIGVFSGGKNIALYRAIEDVTVIESIVTAYALSVLDAPVQVVSGQNFDVTVHLEIPQSESYASFALHMRLKGPSQGAANVCGVPVGANDIQLIGLRSTDWWYQTALPRGTYDLEMRLVKQWVEVIGNATYTYSDLPLGDYRAYAQIQIV